MESLTKYPIFALLLTSVALWSCAQPGERSTASVTPSTEQTTKTNEDMEKATLGAGCFWCVEAIFENLKGLATVEAGYAGGQVKNPTYKEVCSGKTGHAEVAQLTFDPEVISYEELLEVFWHTHDPTTLNRQGNDVGTQYRSVIFYHNEAQRQTAEKSKALMDASGEFDNSIVTDIEPLSNYSKAENYHQDYFKHNPNQPYCRAVIQPKVEKFKKHFKSKLKEEAR